MLVSRITAPLPTKPTSPSAHVAAPPGEAVRLAIAVVESMMGRRPLHHLRRWLSPDAFMQLRVSRESGRFMRSRVGGMRCQMPTETAAEISIRISVSDRWLVCVLRLDRRVKWTCSEFFVLGV